MLIMYLYTIFTQIKYYLFIYRSLDLSNWSVDSRSSSLYTSSGSEESMAIRNGRSISRNSSDASRQLNLAPISSALETPSETPNTKLETPSEPRNTSTLKSSNTNTTTRNKGATNNSNDAAAVLRSKTVITLMGGRGYINWRQPCCSVDKSKASTGAGPNNHDAHIVIWELKL